jgi:hypothetical protein
MLLFLESLFTLSLVYFVSGALYPARQKPGMPTAPTNGLYYERLDGRGRLGAESPVARKLIEKDDECPSPTVHCVRRAKDKILPAIFSYQFNLNQCI